MNFWQKTFGGLNFQYYLRHFIFGLIFSGMIIYLAFFASTKSSPNWSVIPMVLINQFLYPYARFVYESIVGYIFGQNFMIANGLLFFGLKLLTMSVCWVFAMFVAPVGLIYLYFYHSKQEKEYFEDE